MPVPRCWSVLVIACALSVSLGVGAGVFRTGLVLNGSHPLSVDRLKGYALFLSRFSELYPYGFPIGGHNFSFTFSAITDISGNANKDLKDLIEDGGRDDENKSDEGVHFLFGVETEPAIAEQNGKFAEKKRRVMLHCCATDDVFGGRRWEYFFTMLPNYHGALDMLVPIFALQEIKRVAIIYDHHTSWMRGACESIVKQVENVAGIRHVVVDTGSRLHSEEGIQEFVNLSVEEGAEAVIGCTLEQQSKALIQAFWAKQHGLKGSFYAEGPNKQSFIDDLGEKAEGVIGASLFHKSARFGDDAFFGDVPGFLAKLDQDDPEFGIPAASASFLGLMIALQDAFKDCNVTGAGGDVDKLLFERGAIICPDGKNYGYERARLSLRFLDVPSTPFGPIIFDKYNRNTRGTTPVLLTQVLSEDGKKVPEVVFPVEAGTTKLSLPVRNPFAVRPPCPEGTFLSQDSFEPCKPCPAGSFTSGQNRDGCNLCAVTQYNPDTNQTQCSSCPANTETRTEGSTSINKCRCLSGFYNKNGSTGEPCVPCPEGAQCDGGTNLPVPMAGYWSDKDLRHEVYACDSEHACPRGFECGRMHSGRLCAQCSEGFFNAMERCWECQSTGVTVLLLLALAVVWFLINAFVSTRVDSFEMILNWVQLVNIVGTLPLDWPAQLNNLFEIASIMDFDVDAIEPTCLYSQWSFRSNFIVQLLLPVLLSAMALARYLVYYLRFKSAFSGGARLGSRMMHRISSFLRWGIPKRRGREWMNEKWNNVVAQSLAAVEVTYLTITRYCFEVLKCETVAGVRVMTASVDVECSSAEYRTLFGLAVTGLAVYTCGYLAFTTYKLLEMYQRKEYSRTSNLQRYGFLYERFELGYAWIALFSLGVRIVFVAVLVLVDSPLAAAGIMALVTMTWLLVQVYTLPYVQSSMDFLQTCLLVGLLALAYSGLMFSKTRLPDENRSVLEYGELAIVCVMALFTAVVSVREVAIKLRLKFIQKRHRDAVLRSLPPDVDSQIIKNDILVSGVDMELYDALSPRLLYGWLKDADQDTLMRFDKLSIMLRDFLSVDSYTSYLSLEIPAEFWRKLVASFPEIIDFLVMCDFETRSHFCKFLRVFYRDFFLRKHIESDNLYSLVDWKDRAALAQWLALSSRGDRQFFVDTIIEASSSQHDRTDQRKTTPNAAYRDSAHPNWADIMNKMSVHYRSALSDTRSGGSPLTHKKRAREMREEEFDRTELCRFARMCMKNKGWKLAREKVMQVLEAIDVEDSVRHVEVESRAGVLEDEDARG